MPTSSSTFTRRRALAGLGAGVLWPARGRAQEVPPTALRVATADYGLAQTLIALGHPPVAMAAADDWAKWVVDPPLPAQVVDLGSAREINFEILQQVRPDLILSTPYLERLRPTFARIAPVESFPIHATGSPPWPNLIAATRRLGARIGASGRAETFLAQVDAALDASRARVARWRDRPLLLVAFQDARNAWVFGANSLYDDALQRLGLANGWTGRTNAWGFSAVGMEALATAREARLVCFDPVPPDALRLLAGGPIWQATGFADPGRVLRLPPVLAFGALPSATRLARLLAEAAAGA